MEQSGQSVAGSEDSFGQAPEEYLKGSIALGFARGASLCRVHWGKIALKRTIKEIGAVTVAWIHNT